MIKSVKGDITQLPVEAIVNAANSDLRPGAGVCGAIYKAAGMSLDTETQLFYPGGVATGRAVITSGHNLKARYVIHAVGPILQPNRKPSEWERKMLEATYASVFELAIKHGVKTIAIPAISTGIYGFPKAEAARIAVKAARNYEYNFKGIALVAFDDDTAALYEKELDNKKVEDEATQITVDGDPLPPEIQARLDKIDAPDKIEEAEVIDEPESDGMGTDKGVAGLDYESPEPVDEPITCSKCGAVDGHIEPCEYSVGNKIKQMAAEMAAEYENSAQAKFIRERADKQKKRESADEPQGTLGL